MGHVNARDHGPECSVAGVRNRTQDIQEEGLILCSFRNVTRSREPALSSEHLEALR